MVLQGRSVCIFAGKTNGSRSTYRQNGIGSLVCKIRSTQRNAILEEPQIGSELNLSFSFGFQSSITQSSAFGISTVAIRRRRQSRSPTIEVSTDAIVCGGPIR